MTPEDVDRARAVFAAESGYVMSVTARTLGQQLIHALDQATTRIEKLTQDARILAVGGGSYSDDLIAARIEIERLRITVNECIEAGKELGTDLARVTADRDRYQRDAAELRAIMFRGTS